MTKAGDKAKSVIDGTTEKVREWVDTAKEVVGKAVHKKDPTAGEKVKGAIDRTAEKARDAVDQATDVANQGAGKAKETFKQVGQKVIDAGERIKEKGR